MAARRSRIEGSVRAGMSALRLIGDPINVSILRQLGGTRLSAGEVASNLPPASRSTRFNRLRELEINRVLVRETLATMPRTSRYKLPDAGNGLRAVADDVEAWLREAAGGSVLLGTANGSVAVKALRVGWNTGIVHRLGECPASLTELDAGITDAGFHHLRHAIRILVQAGLVSRDGRRNGRQPYRLTRFGRCSSGAIASAIRWETSHLPDSSPSVTPGDIEALLKLAAPLVVLPENLEGACRLQVQNLGDVTFKISEGRVVGCLASPDGRPQGFVRGTQMDWRVAIIAGNLSCLAISGDDQLATEIVRGLRNHFAPLRVEQRQAAG